MRITAIASALLLLAAAGPAAAAPTEQVAGGRTSVRLSPEFLGALSGLGVQTAAIGPAFLGWRWASFPIPAGALDLETARGDVFHSGGLSLKAGATEVRLLNFVIDTQEAPVLTGLVSVNGDLVGRVPLFDLMPSEDPVLYRSGLLVLRGVGVELTAVAAEALNGIFGVTDFAEGLPIGHAVVVTKVLESKRRSYDRDDDDDRDDD